MSRRIAPDRVATDPAGRVRTARVAVGSVALDPLSLGEAVTYIRDRLARGSGGRMAIVDIDLHRRSATEPMIGVALAHATLVLAGSRPIVWASRIAGRGLPRPVPRLAAAERLVSACASDRRTIYLVGGAPGGYGVPSGAQRASAILGLRYRGLRLAGCLSPPAGWEGSPTACSALLGDIVDAKPDVVMLGGHLAYQEEIVTAVRAELPGCWVATCAGFVDSVVGVASRREGCAGEIRGALARVLHGAHLLGGAAVGRAGHWFARAGGWFRPR